MPRIRTRAAALLMASALALSVGPLAVAEAAVYTPEPVQYTTRAYAGDGTSGDAFGLAVAMDGNTAVVGAPNDNGGEGSAYVYEYTAAGWTFSQRLSVDSDPLDNFGMSVDVDGDYIIVGAPYADSDAAADSGIAVVFERTPTGWELVSPLEPDADASFDHFGWSVAVSGDRAVVGCPGDDQMRGNAGAIYIYTEGSSSYVKYMSAAAEVDSEYGKSVDIYGDWIVVGAPYDDTGDGVDAGSAHFYHWDGAFWDYEAYCSATDPDAGDYYGFDVAMSADTVLIGAMHDHVGAVADAGSVQVRTRNISAWPVTQELTSPWPGDAENFGMSVAVDGDFAVIGAPWDDATDGSAHVYQHSSNTWSLLDKMSGDANDVLFGYSVAASEKGHGVIGSMYGRGLTNQTGVAYMLAHLAPVYRFYNPGAGTHFFTSSAEERDHVIATWPTIFTYEGVAYSVNPHNNPQPLYRFYKPSSSSHFYTASEAERDHVIATWPTIYSYDGPTYAVTSYAEAAKPAVYRFYNLTNGSHFYTASAEEADHVIATWPHIYQYEGPAFWLGQ